MCDNANKNPASLLLTFGAYDFGRVFNGRFIEKPMTPLIENHGV